LVKGRAGTDGITIGFVAGISICADVEDEEGTALGALFGAMGTTLGVLAGTVSTGRSQAFALESKVFILAGIREISIDSKMDGVLSNDASSKTVRSGGTAVDATSNGGKVGVSTSGGGTAASTGADLPPSIGGLSYGRVGRSIKGG
jgi:hypothetical protein